MNISFLKRGYIFLSQDNLFIFLSLFKQMSIHFLYIFEENFYFYISMIFYKNCSINESPNFFAAVNPCQAGVPACSMKFL